MTNTLLTTAYKAAEDKKALDIVVLNMEGVSVMADQFIICHANSERQVQAIAREVIDQATKAGFPIRRMEGFETGRWVLADLGDIVVHVFHKDERDHYNLEKLWGDAPKIDMANAL
ncbi:ribosome silencing factor [Sporosarcina jiandibaonis]|uniref:ribosome silencing factor n=1 Tax=Sporosarcina jiandibaonis TaxID=2715535 RepID=UPI0015558699|nr:ribosome silencing factor [Sporosarcina jiandibaonis]